MNLSKAWNVKLEAGIFFWPSKNCTGSVCYVIPTHSSLQVDQISGKIEGQFLIPHARSDPRDLTQLHTKTKVDAGPDLMNPTYRFEYDGPEGNGSWREIQPLSLTGENVIFFFELLVSK